MTAELQGVMGFALPKDVVPDTERKGRLRALTESKDYTEASQVIDFQRCNLHDLASGQYDIDFSRMGFDSIDLNEQPKMKPILDKVKAQGYLEKADIRSLRRTLSKSSFKLSNGKRLRLVYVAGEGILVRSSGPNNLAIEHDEALPTHSKQAAATMIHGDQDVYGFPLKRIMKGAAPWIFHHDSPDGKNSFSPVNLVNVWIPLQQVNMPLCLMDRTTLNKQEHQLRFEINVQDTLQRSAEKARNDIWAFLHDAQQSWYFNSEMASDSAYVFDTLGMAHGAAILPGEKQAEAGFLALSDCQKALQNQDREAFLKAATVNVETDVITTRRLNEALNTMKKLLRKAINERDAIFSDSTSWEKEVNEVKQSLIRKSIELRAVGIVY